MTDLELHEHRRCKGVYCDPDEAKIEKVDPDAPLTLRRTADLLRVPMEDLQELLDSGALASDTDANGRAVVRGADLLKFHAGLRPVYFTESDGDDAADDQADEESEASAATATPPAPAVAVIAPPAPPTRTNPGDDGAEEPDAGWVKLRLSDLRRLLRGEPVAQMPPTRGGR